MKIHGGVDISRSSGLRLEKPGITPFKIFFVLLAVAACIFIVGYTLGCRAEIVLSGSMEPAINAGGLIFTRPISPEEIKAGDILTYVSTSGRETICHRVVSVEENPLRFITRGDANKSSDPSPVSPAQVIGLVCLQVPYLGYVLRFVRSPLILLGIIALFAFFIIAPERLIYWKSEK